MNLAELKEAYKARKLALDSAKKEEEKYKALLKDAMLEAGESDYTDEAGYRFERIVQERKSMDEEKLLAELHERTITLTYDEIRDIANGLYYLSKDKPEYTGIKDKCKVVFDMVKHGMIQPETVESMSKKVGVKDGGDR